MRAAGQNLKRLLKKRGWGRHPWPQGAVKALVEHPSEDHVPLYAPPLPDKALACREKLRVKDLVIPLPVLRKPLVFAPSLALRSRASSGEASIVSRSLWIPSACLWLFRHVISAQARHR